MLVHGRSYEVNEWHVTVDDLHTANFLVEHSACTILGVEAVKRAKNILVKRGQGLGDILMMTPMLRKIKAENPDAKLTFACFEIFEDVCRGLPYIDRIVTTGQLGFHLDESWVIEADGSKTLFDYWINCDGIAEHKENNEKIATMHRVDIFGELAGFSFTETDRKLDFHLYDEDRAWAAKEWKRLGLREDEKVLAMAVRTTCFNRNMPAEKFRAVAQMATEGGWRVMLFDHDGAFGWEGPGIVNKTGRTTIRQMAALLERCRMFFGPDTGAWHLACSLGLPNVVYFGAIDWRLRITMPKTRVMHKKPACYPCNRYDCHWPVKLECIDLDPRALWELIDRYDGELARENKQTSTPVGINPEPAKLEVIDGGKAAPEGFINNFTGRPLSVR